MKICFFVHGKLVGRPKNFCCPLMFVIHKLEEIFKRMDLGVLWLNIMDDLLKLTYCPLAIEYSWRIHLTISASDIDALVNKTNHLQKIDVK